MIEIRRSDDRGYADHGWLKTRHTFSFGDYRDPRFMGYRSLRVINDDVIEPDGGFPTHPHRDMEILTWVVEGALEHRDSMGNGSVIRPGDAQRMSAGTGVTHSEFNPSGTEGLRLLQIWILPRRPGLEPEYEQRHFDPEERRGRLRVIASPNGREGSVTIHQDASVLAGLFDKGQSGRHEVAGECGAWIQIVRGRVRLGDTVMHEGDGASVGGPAELAWTAEDDAEILVFDLS